MLRSSRVLPRVVAVRQLHCSSPVLKAKKSKNPSQNTVSAVGAGKPPSSEPIPQQNKSPDESAPIPPPSSSSPSEPSEPILPSSPAAPPSSEPSPSSTSNSSSIPPEDANPLNSEQYQAYRGKQSTGPFTWKAAALFLLTGAGLVIYFRIEKERIDRLRTLYERLC